MTEANSNKPVIETDTSVSESIDEDLGCRRCGYNLRGLNEALSCPECGTEVARSLLENHLKFCDPDWVRLLASGARWLLVGAIINLLTTTLTVLYEYFYSVRMSMAVEGILAASAAVFIWGVWLISSDEPGLIGPRGPVLKFWVRATLFLAIFFIVFDLVMHREIYSIFFWAASSFVSLTATTVWIVLCYRYMAVLAMRLPDKRIVKITNRFVVGNIYFYFINLGFILLSFQYYINGFGSVYPVPGYTLFVYYWYVLQALYILINVWAVLVLACFRKTMARTALDSAEIWAKEIRLRNVYRGGHRIRCRPR